MLWILFWGLIPPIMVGVWSYRQGKNGYNEAIASRDAAMTSLGTIKAEMSKIQAALETIPNKDELLNSVQKSIQGTYGRLIRSGKEAVQGEIDELAEDIQSHMSPEEVQAAMGQKMLGALQKKVMSFFD